MSQVIICGAGIAGVSAAYHLAVRGGIRDIAIVDERAPLTLTSDKSTECYRNWWPGPGDAMVALMNRSIDILEDLANESGNAFNLNRRGYLYATADPRRIADLRRAGEEAASLGAGPLRVHPGAEAYVPSPAHGYHNLPIGSDLILDPAVIRKHFPYLSDSTVAVLHARRCGYLSAQTYGMYMYEKAREAGVRFISARIDSLETRGGRVRGIRTADGESMQADNVILAAGPFNQALCQTLGVELPLFCELHTKVVFDDRLGAMPRDTPLLIWIDKVHLPWSSEERELLTDSSETQWMLEEMPSGVHGRSEGGVGSSYFLLQWTLHTEPRVPEFPLKFDQQYPELALRGLSVMLPALDKYFHSLPRFTMDGGYYCKTQENRPLVGPLPVEGAYIIGGLGGFGIMASSASGDLLASHVTGSALPRYASAFSLSRYSDPAYQELLTHWDNTGQL